MLLTSLMQIASALMTPVIAPGAVWIAARQSVIADEKLRLDEFERLYDRRFAVYLATRSFMQDIYGRNFTDDTVNIYALISLDAEFLFPNDLFRYVREVSNRGGMIQMARSKKSAAAPDEASVFAQMERDNMEWFRLQGDDATGISAHFKPFLQYTKPKRPFILRWP